MCDLINAVNQLRAAIALYSEFPPNEAIVEIRLHPVALDCIKHVLWRELQKDGSFFATNIDHAGPKKNLEIYGIKFLAHPFNRNQVEGR